jgi:hypothetical protein
LTMTLVFMFAYGYFAVKGYYEKVDAKGCAVMAVIYIVLAFLSFIPGVDYIVLLAMCYYIGKGLYLTFSKTSRETPVIG